MKRILRWIATIAVWFLYELFLDGSGIGLKQRWQDIKAWANSGRIGNKKK